MHAAYTDIEAEVSGSEDNSQDNSLFDEEEDNMMEDFIDDDETMEDEGTHVAMDMDNAALEAEQTREFAQRLQERLSQVQATRAPVPAPLIPVSRTEKKQTQPQEVSAAHKPIGPQIVFMPDKPSINIASPAKPVLTLALPVWLGVYSKGSLAEVEMAQAIQYVLNAATMVQQKDDARIYVTLWCMGRPTSVKNMSYKEALRCSANPGKYVAEIFCQDIASVKKFSDCLNDVRTHLKQGETKDYGMSFISKLKKKIEMSVSRDRFNLIEPRMISDGMQLSRALVSVAQKIGTANAVHSNVPQWIRVASQSDILNLHSVEEDREDSGELVSSEIISSHWQTMFGRDRVIEAMTDSDTYDRIKQAIEANFWRPHDMPAFDMNNTNCNNVFFYSDAPGTPSFELTKMLMTEKNKVGFQEVMVQHNQSNTTLHQVMKKVFEEKNIHWRDRCHAITMWAASHHPQLWPWEHNQRYWMENKVLDPGM